jgi:hypothetical protein
MLVRVKMASEMAEDRHTNEHRLRARYAACIAMRLVDEAAAAAHAVGVTEDEQIRHLQSSAHALDTWQPDAFEDFDGLPPGRFDPRVFNQTTFWVDILRRPHRIDDRVDFSDDYLGAVLRFVRREAWRWAAFPEFQDDDLVPLHWFMLEATTRIEQTPLVQALVAEAKSRGLTTS